MTVDQLIAHLSSWPERIRRAEIMWLEGADGTGPEDLRGRLLELDAPGCDIDIREGQPGEPHDCEPSS